MRTRKALQSIVSPQENRKVFKVFPLVQNMSKEAERATTLPQAQLEVLANLVAAQMMKERKEPDLEAVAEKVASHIREKPNPAKEGDPGPSSSKGTVQCWGNWLSWPTSWPMGPIARAARDDSGGNWLSYDYQFRQKAAAKGMRTGWGSKDVPLWSDLSQSVSIQDPEHNHSPISSWR